jgi:hypothetical protein
VARTRTVITALTLVSVLALGACSEDDPEPKFAPTPSTSAPTSPSTTAAPDLESPRKQQADLIDQFVKALSESLGTGDPTGFLKLSSKSCQNCQVLADNLNDAYAGGGHIENGSWSLISSNYQGEKPLGSIWNVDIRSARERWFGENGDLVKIVRGGVQRFGLAIEENRDQWRVRELRLRG